MSTANVHLIVTCTRRKTVAAGDAVYPDDSDVERAYGLWLERLAKAIKCELNRTSCQNNVLHILMRRAETKTLQCS